MINHYIASTYNNHKKLTKNIRKTRPSLTGVKVITTPNINNDHFIQVLKKVVQISAIRTALAKRDVNI